MADKPVSLQFIAVVRTRTNDANAIGEAGPNFAATDDTGLVARSGTYNRPANPGEEVFTSERAALQAAISVNSRMQLGLGQNCRITIYGKVCGTAPANAARQLLPGELVEKVYSETDTVSAGLHDAVRYANRVPNVNSIIIRSEAGPEAQITNEAVSGA